MGYCMDLQEKKFKIRKENAENVVNALKEFAKNFKGTYDNRIMWVDKSILINSESIEESFDEIRYPLTTDTNGDYIIDYFSGEKLGDDTQIFMAIAPFVEDGSYIEMSGEDGTLWRWVFKNGKCEEKYPEIKWD
jgi:hypothetical protein